MVSCKKEIVWAGPSPPVSIANRSQVRINFKYSSFSPVKKVGKSKYGHAHTFLHEPSNWIFMRAMRGPCQLIRWGGWWLHPSPYVFFQSEQVQSEHFSHPSNRRTFSAAKTTNGWRARMKSFQQSTDMSSTSQERSCGVTMGTENTNGMLKR